MPYIKQDSRDKYDNLILPLSVKLEEAGSPVGDLNYIVSSLVWRIFDANPSYTVANGLVGALECAKQEFLRRKVALYEDLKVKENGDL